MVPLDVWRTVCREYVTAQDCVNLCELLQIPLQLPAPLAKAECSLLPKFPAVRPQFLRELATVMTRVTPPGICLRLKNSLQYNDVWMNACIPDVMWQLLQHMGDHCCTLFHKWVIREKRDSVELIFRYNGHRTELPVITLDLGGLLYNPIFPDITPEVFQPSEVMDTWGSHCL